MIFAWEHCKLGDVADITTGSRNHQDSVTDGKYPFFVRSDKVERLNEYDFDTKAILVPGDGRIGEIFHYYSGKFALHQRVYKVDNFNGINALFLLGQFKYSFKTDTKLDLTYSYYIDAKVQINTAEGKNILEKKYKILDNKEIQDVNNSFTIDEKDISIDYKKYNELASSFLDRYSIDGDALLKVGLYVNVQGNNEKFEQGLSDNAVVSITIPLTKRTTDISLKYDYYY